MPLCECEPPVPNFVFPTTIGDMKNDQRFTVVYGDRLIHRIGLNQITDCLYRSLEPSFGDGAFTTINALMANVEPRYQTERGNYARRLSAAFHAGGINLSNVVLERVGQIARSYQPVLTTIHMEFTRQLNQPATYFGRSDSCWWRSKTDGREYDRYDHCRCGLKNWGGLAMRSFPEIEGDNDHPDGRAFVLPLGADLKPSHDVGSGAYLVVNCYEMLSELTAVQVLSHLRGLPHKRVSFRNTTDQWEINGRSGYLVADQAICDATTFFNMNYDHHERFDADKFISLKRAA